MNKLLLSYSNKNLLNGYVKKKPVVFTLSLNVILFNEKPLINIFRTAAAKR